MAPRVVTKDDTYVLNHCTKYLARDNTDPRHDYGQYDAGDPRARIAEAWRFPIVDSYYDGRAREPRVQSASPSSTCSRRRTSPPTCR